MKSLKQYLTEALVVNVPEHILELIKAKDDLVFHFTSIDGAKGIIQSNEMWVNAGKVDMPGLSTTFDPNYSRGQCDVCFCLNCSKLAKDFESIYVDEMLGDNECEIKFLSEEPITNIRTYVTDIKTDVKEVELLLMISEYLK